VDFYQGRVLRIDLGAMSVQVEPLRTDWAELYVGGNPPCAVASSRACAAAREGGTRNESGSSANARQTNALTLHSPRHHLPTLRPYPVRLGWHSAALAGVYQQIS
jgi:hypothetical protein